MDDQHWRHRVDERLDNMDREVGEIRATLRDHDGRHERYGTVTRWALGLLLTMALAVSGVAWKTLEVLQQLQVTTAEIRVEVGSLKAWAREIQGDVKGIRETRSDAITGASSAPAPRVQRR